MFERVGDAGEEVVGVGPLRRGPVDSLDGGRVAGQVLDQVGESSPGELAGAEVEDVDAVVAEEVGFEGPGVLPEEDDEPINSPRDAPCNTATIR